MGKFIGGGRQFGSNGVKHRAECRVRQETMQAEGSSGKVRIFTADGADGADKRELLPERTA
jgi:hypothetical protein